MNARSSANLADISISESDGVRYLHFGTPWVQGAMRLAHPYALELDYIKNMMAWWLFLRPVATTCISQLGLGAAALSKFCLRRCAPARISVVELNPRVIQIAQDFFHFPVSHERLELFCCDAQKWLQQQPQASCQILQVDLYDAEARGPVHDSLDFYQVCREVLTEPGILVVNLFGQHQSFTRSMRHLAQVFDGRLVSLRPTAEGNTVVLAFLGPVLQVAWPVLMQRAQQLEKKTGLPATGWVKWLKKQRPGAFFMV